MDRKKGREPSCVVCSSQFFFKDPFHPYGPRCPLLLTCGHSVCEGCVKTLSRGKASVTCPVCSTPTETITFKNVEELREEFPLNVYAVGQVSLRRVGTLKSDSAIGFYSQNKKMASDSVVCCECQLEPAVCSCRQCNDRFCGPCFTKIHSAGVSLRKHEQVPLNDSEKTSAFQEARCDQHPENLFEYFCNACTEYSCKDCCVDRHLSHDCVKVIEKNKEIYPEFSELFEDATSVLKQLYFTQKKLKSMGPQKPMDTESVAVEEEVRRHFGHLHGILQLQEAEILKQIHNVHQQTSQSLLSAINQIELNIKELECIIKESKIVMQPNYLSSIPLITMLDKLKSVAALPCHLILNDDQDSSKFNFTVDSAVIDMLKGHCALTVPTTRVYELHSKLDLPDDFVVENIPDDSDQLVLETPDFALIAEMKSQEQKSPTPKENSTPKLPQGELKTKGPFHQKIDQRKTKTLFRNTNADDNLSTASTESALEMICNLPPLKEGSTELVNVCHLISPNSFYVNRRCCVSQLEKLRESFSKFAIKKPPLLDVELGHMYLVNFTQDKRWYRAVVKKIIDGKKFEVSYVDYGNTETVTINKLREIPERYASIPEQAIHCSLFGCTPLGGHWNSEVFTLMASMTNGIELSMYVERVNEYRKLYEVYLRSIDETSISVIDALVYLSHAVKTESTDKEGGLFKKPHPMSKRSFFKDVVKKGDTFDGIVTHINTPGHFYIQRLVDGGKKLMQLMQDLTYTYNRLGSKEQMVYSPTIGMPVAVKQADGNWHRAKILGTPEHRRVEVQFVDFGKVETIDWTNMRALQQKFLKMGAQGLKCSLHDVAPNNPKGWTASAKKAFENMSKDKYLRIFVEDITDSAMSICLYESKKFKDVCFNGLLVEKGLARSIGQSSAKSEYSRGPQMKPDRDSLSTVSSETFLPQNWGSRQSLAPSTAGSSSTEPARDLRDSEEARRFRVKMLKFISPAEFHLTSSTLLQQVSKLFEDMTKFYETTEVDVIEWSLGDLCAVRRKEDNKWYRGLISDVSTKYKVFIKDIVDVVEADISEMRKLDPQFMKVNDGSFKCHLKSILPTGGSKNWALSTLDYLNSLITEHTDNLYITDLGELVNDSLPVQLWIKSIKASGPLDPVREEWMDVGKSVVEMGLALQDRHSRHLVPLKTEEVICEELAKDESRENHVRSWLEESYQEAHQSASVTHFEKINKPSASTSVVNKVEPRRIMRNLPKQIPMEAFNKFTNWKPAEPFKRLEFIANPTYVDFECSFYIQDLETSRGTLELIKKSLKNLFDGSIAKPQDKVWTPGQLCIAFYEQDSSWYRGKVTKVTLEHIEVLFVDYGNVEHLQPDELRKQVTLGHIPIQCHRCLTAGLIPISLDGKWPVKTLDFIHATIVEKECLVRLQPPSTELNEYVVLSLTVPGGVDLIGVLLSMHYATYVLDCDQMAETNNTDDDIIADPDNQVSQYTPSVVKSPKFKEIKETDNLSEINDRQVMSVSPQVEVLKKTFINDWYDMTLETKIKAFKDFPLPESLDEMLIELGALRSSTSLSVNILTCDDDEVSLMLHDYKILHGRIQDEADNLPMVTQLTTGMLCVGCYTEDGSWYRAVVKEIMPEEGLVKVNYVDYGNEEKIPRDRLREIPEDWKEMPVQALTVSLFNVSRGPSYNPVICHSMLQNCLTYPPYTMLIKARLPTLQVELFNEEGDLAYQSLIDKGIFTII